jgi:hypothetical protein
MRIHQYALNFRLNALKIFNVYGLVLNGCVWQAETVSTKC